MVYPFNVSYNVGDNKFVMNGSMVTQNGIIKSVTVVDPKNTIQKFADGINEKVVGKPYANLQVDTISGASYTTAAFNEFLKTLK